MGHDQHQQPISSGTLVAVIGVGLVLAILGIVVVGVAAVGLFWLRAARMESRDAVVAEQRAIEQLHRAEVMARQAAAQAQHEKALFQLEQSRVAATPDPELTLEVRLDREGNASIDGEGIDLPELRVRLANLKDETSNAFSVRINADSECLFRHVVSVMDVCKEVGGIDYRVASSSDTDSSPDEEDAAS